MKPLGSGSGGWIGSLDDDWEPVWLIEGVLLKHGLNFLIGPPKARKSTLRRFLTAAVLAGTPALGLRVRRAQRVLVLIGEGILEAESTLQHRVCRAVGLAPTEYGNRVWIERPFGLSLSSPAGLDELLAFVRREHFDLVCIDPLVTFHRVDENDNMAMSHVCDALLQLCTVATVLAVHHTAKPSENDARKTVGQKSRGASALAGFTDVSLLLTKRGESEGGRLEFETRYGAPRAPLELWYEHDTGLWVPRAEGPTLPQRVEKVLSKEPNLRSANDLVRKVHGKRQDVLRALRARHVSAVVPAQVVPLVPDPREPV